jgi:hypothetical protein
VIFITIILDHKMNGTRLLSLGSGSSPTSKTSICTAGTIHKLLSVLHLEDFSYYLIMDSSSTNALFPVVVDPNGDAELVIQGYRFILSSSSMSAASPELRKAFNVQDGSPWKIVELPNEDPIVFYLICQSAHGIFIPKAHIALDTLVKVVDTIRRYRIPATSSIHEVAVSCFDERTLLLETISISDLTMFLPMAKDLGFSIYTQLVEDIFLLYPFDFGPLPIEPTLRDLKIKSAAYRVQLANLLMHQMTEPAYQEHNDSLFTWVLFESPSLRMISSRLDWEIEQVSGYKQDQLKRAGHVIDQAKADIKSRYCKTAGPTMARKNGSSQQEALELRLFPVVTRLKVQIAYDEHDAKASLSASSSASSSGTDFVDIEAYCKPVDEKYDPYLHYDDNVSIKSCKTI